MPPKPTVKQELHPLELLWFTTQIAALKRQRLQQPVRVDTLARPAKDRTIIMAGSAAEGAGPAAEGAGPAEL